MTVDLKWHAELKRNLPFLLDSSYWPGIKRSHHTPVSGEHQLPWSLCNVHCMETGLPASIRSIIIFLVFKSQFRLAKVDTSKIHNEFIIDTWIGLQEIKYWVNVGFVTKVYCLSSNYFEMYLSLFRTHFNTFYIEKKLSTIINWSNLAVWVYTKSSVWINFTFSIHFIQKDIVRVNDHFFSNPAILIIAWPDIDQLRTNLHRKWVSLCVSIKSQPKFGWLFSKPLHFQKDDLLWQIDHNWGLSLNQLWMINWKIIK